MTNKIKATNTLYETCEQFLLHEERCGGGYDASGWQLRKIDTTYYLSYFSHCSCYSTDDDIYEYVTVHNSPKYLKRLRYAWCGNYKELSRLASGVFDPYLPDRVSEVNDSDFNELYMMYRWILSNLHIIAKEEIDAELKESQRLYELKKLNGGKEIRTGGSG